MFDIRPTDGAWVGSGLISKMDQAPLTPATRTSFTLC